MDEREKEMPVYACDKEGAEREGGGGRRCRYRERLGVCVCMYACMRGCVLAFVKLVCLCLLACFSSVGILYTTAGKHTAAWVCDLRHWAGARVKDCSHRITHPQAPFPKTF